MIGLLVHIDEENFDTEMKSYFIYKKYLTALVAFSDLLNHITSNAIKLLILAVEIMYLNQ